MNTEEEILATRERKKKFAKKVARYVDQMAMDFDGLSCVDAVAIGVYALTQDIGMAQEYLEIIGVDIDLYTYDFNKKKEEVSNADRTERAPEGSDQASRQREDTLRGRGEWKDGDNTWVLRGERNPS